MAFSLEAKPFRGWRASVEQRQAGSLRVGCGLLVAGCWLLVRAWWCWWCGSSRISGWLGWLAGVGRWSGFEQTLLGLVHLHACAAATLDGNTAALALHTLLPPLHSPLHFLSMASSSEPAGGLTAATWDVFGRGQDAVRASEARIGVTCTGRALQSACSIFLQGLTGRGAFCWPPFAALLVSVAGLCCWSLLALTGMLEGVREWGRALSVCSLFSALGVALSQIRPCNTTPSGQVRMPNLHREQHLQPAWIGAMGQSAVVIVWGLLTHDSHQPGRSVQLHQAHLTSPPFCTHVQSSVVAAACSGPKKLSAGSVRQQAATPAQQGKQGTPFAGDAM
ncbi:uncharacterized protein K444DRAFT_701798 [Hyaloscypha bicolor E]|uniref:Uncharacterized protein n=1 Tax=Hyaloscypha bicolor E TaxID=1095630 RepID=A0A2J6TT66_9HELO|nr:uncharacterized protein K444DRAFT_701798 [Hyaloscypha bicolor E]PMD66158.1 hypothetical protein K444DRAFT_701798 [Hyaloscypha bicolor E]